ncbi:cytochrome oxidase assembly protein 1, partial [Piptocephalis cylindrospora]
ILAYATLGVLTWTGILAVAFNYQRQESSVVAGTFFALQHDPQVQAHLGDHVHWDFPVFPWIHGTVNYLKGIVDISFRIRGDQGKEA